MSASTKQLQRKIGCYSVGELLGKGAMGSVYKGMHVDTGLIVAIQNLKDEQLKQIQSEISLLKRLNHEYIVKYIDYIQTESHLNIILEFVECSLASIIKKFGSSAENLVSNYIKQVLMGLDYLHSQGVVHRDIKGANILTTKEGKIKLADFGVATRLTDDEKAQSFVGTPYWMAPELIEMRGHISSACDIWSLGCTVIELITGQPPYHDLYQYPALFRIVQDDHPPLPENLSQSCQEFLLLCFQKDPNLRSDAKTLLKHEWIKQQEKEEIYEMFSKNSFSRQTGKASKDIQVICEKLQNYNLLKQNEIIQYVDQIQQNLENTEFKYYILQNCGLSIFTEILDDFIEDQQYHQIVQSILQMVNSILEKNNNQKILENISQFGILPQIINFSQSNYPKQIRLLSAQFLVQMFYCSIQTQQIVIASGGLYALSEFLDPDYFQNQDLIKISIKCLLQTFQNMSHINLCKILLKYDILHRLVIIIDQMNQDLYDTEQLDKILQILLYFSETEVNKFYIGQKNQNKIMLK